MIGDFFARFDPELWSNYVDLIGKGNIKNDIEEYIRTRVAAESTSDIDIEILRKEISELRKSKLKIDAELKSKLNIEHEYNQKISQNEKLRLKEQKEILLKSKKCIQCGNIFGKQEKRHEFNKGYACNTCFHNATPEMIKTWMYPKEVIEDE